MEARPGKTKTVSEEFSVEEFNVHDELENKLRSSAQNLKRVSSSNGAGKTGSNAAQLSPTQKQNFQYSSISSGNNSGQKGYLTAQQQQVKSKISDIELLWSRACKQ